MLTVTVDAIHRQKSLRVILLDKNRYLFKDAVTHYVLFGLVCTAKKMKLVYFKNEAEKLKSVDVVYKFFWIDLLQFKCKLTMTKRWRMYI